ncbi:MAG: hypothetical protein B6D55_06315 [Candidatus Omnitrophica bacterium 4484_70.2]|nr:MAG: hypothetical protein B6D55_06315 [Candidatus Omnitrophica bacterium 4484_70.2]
MREDIDNDKIEPLKPIREFLGDVKEIQKLLLENAKKVKELGDPLREFFLEQGETFFRKNVCPALDFENKRFRVRELSWKGYQVRCAVFFNLDVWKTGVDKLVLAVRHKEIRFGLYCPFGSGCPLKRFAEVLKEDDRKKDKRYLDL